MIIKIQSKTIFFMFFYFLSWASIADMSDLFNQYSNSNVNNNLENKKLHTKASEEVEKQPEEVISNALKIRATSPGPWIDEIKSRLINAGVDVIESSNTTKTRYELIISSDSPGFLTSCFGGGWQFQYYNAQLVQSSTGAIVSSMSDSGYTENCQPFSGATFSKTVGMVLPIVNSNVQ